jgi:streptogramin lyase
MYGRRVRLKHRLVVSIALCAIGLCLPAAVQAAPTIDEFGGLTADSGVRGIAVGPDGNIWFAEATAMRVGRMNTAGALLSEFNDAITSDPAGLAAGPDGNMWITVQGANAVVRMTPTNQGDAFPVAANADPLNIVAGPDGNLWFTEFDGAIGKMNVSGNVLGEFTTGPGPIDITVGPDNNLWFTLESPPGVSKVTTGGTVSPPFTSGISAASDPSGIAVGPDGNLWFAELGGDRVGRITTSGAVTEFSSGITPGAGPFRIAAGRDGNLWFTEREQGRIGRITPAGVITEFPLPQGGSPQDITLAPDGNLWYTNAGTNKVGRISNYIEQPLAAATPRDVTAASVSHYGFASKTFAALGKGGSIASAKRRKVKRGSTVRYTLSEAATLTFTVERVNAGRRVKGKCRRRTRKNRKRRRCALTLRGSFKHTGKAGANRFKFSGRLRRRKLRPGRYRLVARAVDRAGNKTKPARAAFRIVKP